MFPSLVATALAIHLCLIGLLGLADQGGIEPSALSTLDLISLIMFELSLLLGLLYLAWALWPRLRQEPRRHTQICKIIILGARGVFCLVVLIVSFLYTSSWMLFHSTGRFLDHQSFSFFLVNPVAILQHIDHMEPASLIGTPLIACVLVLMLVWGGRIGSRLIPQRGLAYVLPSILMAGILSVFIVVFVPKSKAPVSDQRVGMVYSYSQAYQIIMEQRIGPLLHGFSKTLSHFSRDGRMPQKDSAFEVISTKQISMQEYLSRQAEQQLRSNNVLVIVVESLRADQLKSFGGSR